MDEQKNQMQVQQPKPLLMERMAAQYGMEPAAFKSVLLKTVFPQDKPVSMEQLGMFAIVAHNYNLNPLLREIYAFPAKGGGIIPVLGYDGWVTIIQRQEDYDGCEYEYIWEDDKVGGKILGVTCSIFRKKHSRPTKKTVWFAEVRRDTDQWKVKPIWMTEIKALIQTARLAYGFGGIYDQDEAENILDAQLKQGADGKLQSEIRMPQRQVLMQEKQEPVNITPAAEAAVVEEKASANEAFIPNFDAIEAAPVEKEGERTFFPGLTDAAPPPVETKNSAWDKQGGIGRGRAQRIYSILSKHKKHTAAELEQVWLKPRGLTHLSDLPLELNETVAQWAEGN